MNRTVSCTRTTKETDIALTLNLDGTGKTQIDTGVGFFDHMLDGFARHGLCAVDLSGRPYLRFQSEFTAERIGDMDTEMIKEFFYAVSYSAMMNIHLRILDGENSHHMAETLFKSFGKALDMATLPEPRIQEAWTTKGSL